VSDAVEAAGTHPRRPVEMVLYVSPGSPASARAQQNIQGLLATLDASRVDLDIRDVSQDPEGAEADRILFIPTLVVRRPLLTWIVGDLTNVDEVLRVLRSIQTEETP
jgi:KaiB domain